MSNDRRNFLKQVGTGAAAAAAVAKLVEQPTQAADSKDTFTVLSRAPARDQLKIAFEIDGEFAGWVDSVEGGSASADVVEQKADNGVVRKHIAGVKYEDITVTCGTGMSKAFYEWIKASFDKKYSRKDGAIHTCDYDNNIVSTLNFFHGLITEIGFPACDAGSKDAAKMTLKFSPEITKLEQEFGRWVGEPGVSDHKHFTASNFKFTIFGLEKSSARVAKVDSITIKQTVATDDIGDARDYSKEPGKLEYPNLKISLGEFYAGDILKWHEDFVIKGNSAVDNEKTGQLDFLAADGKTSLLTLNFYGMGIFDAPRDKQTASDSEQKGSPAMLTVSPQMYVDEIKFTTPMFKNS